MIIPPAIVDLFRRVEAVTLVVTLCVGTALWAFFAIASEMVEGDLHAFDMLIIHALRAPDGLSGPVGGSQIEFVMRDLTALGGVTVLTLVTVLVLGFLVLRRKRASAQFLTVAIIGGLSLSLLMKTGFSRPRPDLLPQSIEVSTASFPSGHSVMAAVTYLTLAVMLAQTEDQPRMRAYYIICAIVLSVLVGISRIYLGVHWPSDVLAGWMLGTAWSLGVWLTARALARRGRI